MLRFIAAGVLALAFATPHAQTLDKIRKSGVITLGYIEGAAPFSFTDGNNEPQGYSIELCRAVAAGIDMYTSKIFAGQLMIEYHSHGPEPEKSVATIHSLLCAIADQQAAVRAG